MSESNHDNPYLPLHPESDARGLHPASFDWESQDDELKSLGLVAAQASTPAIIEDLVAVHGRFDMDATYKHRDGSETHVPHAMLRKLLHAMPSYMESAEQVAMKPEQAYMLIRGIMTAEERSMYSEVHKSVDLLTKAFIWQARHGHQLDLAEQAELGRFLAKAADTNDILVTRVYGHLSRLGFTSAQSTNFIEHDLLMNDDILDQVGKLTHTLSVAKLDPDVLRESCNLMLAGDNYYAMVHNYSLLIDMVYVLVPSLNIPANDLLLIVNSRIRAGETLDDIAASYRGKGARAITGATVYDPLDQRERHFIPQPAGQSLELAALPYRTERSLQAGMADLGRIAVDKVDYGEGLWAFAADAEVPTWYSMGGQTVPDPSRGAVRYQYQPYPIPELSSEPYIFHCHPEELARFGNPHAEDGIFPPAAIPVLDRLTTITPSGRDYTMIAEFVRQASGPFSIRSFIAHSQGFTEYTFPHDPDVIEAVGRNIRAWRDDILFAADWKQMLTRRKLGGIIQSPRETNEVATALVQQLQTRLPRGFELRFIAPGARIEP